MSEEIQATMDFSGSLTRKQKKPAPLSSAGFFIRSRFVFSRSRSVQ